MTMAWFTGLSEALKGAFSKAGSFLTDHFNEFNNGDFKKAAMAHAAQMTMADGSKDAEEVKKVAGIIEKHELLSQFNAAELRKMYTDFTNDFDFDFDFASENIVNTLKKVTEPNQQRGIIMIGIIIGKADGNFDDDEKQVTMNLINLYGHKASDYEQYGL
jgi:tellurite resistance protein TerB